MDFFCHQCVKCNPSHPNVIIHERWRVYVCVGGGDRGG